MQRCFRMHNRKSKIASNENDDERNMKRDENLSEEQDRTKERMRDDHEFAVNAFVFELRDFESKN